MYYAANNAMSILKMSIFMFLQILQNLGKVDRTADEIFDEHVSNFNKQQFSATRLQKELNNYIRCIRGKYISHIHNFGV
jgi:hypothetical protein